MKQKERKDYCVYGHYDDEGRVFYVGAGRPERPYQFQKSKRNEEWFDYVNKNCASRKPKVKIWHQNLTLESAHEHEKFWIEAYGRQCLGKGNLINKSAGGHGTNGVLVSEERRFKLRIALTGFKHGENTKVKMSDSRRGKGRGYMQHKYTKKWKARVKFYKKECHLGYFDTEAEAAEAYTIAVKAIEEGNFIPPRKRRTNGTFF